jgi:hypothetical protein
MTDTSSEEEKWRRARDDRARASFGPFDPLGTISELQAHEHARRRGVVWTPAGTKPERQRPGERG